MGPFYKIPTQRRIEPGDFGGLLDYLLQFHVFPEFYVIRRELIPLTISLTPAFIFWPFLYVGRAIAHMAIVFDPEPFANVTAISDDPQLQQGNKEAMREWDRYRGGLEFIASQANYNGPDAFTRRHALSASIHAFMVARMRVALRLLMNNRQWPDAYILHHRLAAFEGSTLDPAQKSRLGIGAALTTCVQEALGRTRGAVVIDPAVDDSVLGILRTDLAAHVTRERPDGAACYICYTPAFAATVPADAPLLDIRVYIDQFNR